MRLLDRYIGQAVQFAVLAVLGLVMTLFVLVNYVTEFEKIGRGTYTSWRALEYVLLWLPKLLYQFFPMAALLGTMIGLGMLASHSELVVMRAAGVAKLRIAMAATKALLALILIAFFVGEVVAPPAEQYAEQMKLQALGSRITFNTRFGLWLRDGQTVVNVRSLQKGGRLMGVTLYQFDDQRRLVRRIDARSAERKGTQWELQQVRIADIRPDEVVRIRRKTLPWQTMLDKELVDTISYNPDSLSLWNQKAYIDYLKRNGLDARLYELAMWKKIVMPLTILAMILLAVPFVFPIGRQVGMGRQVMIGFLIGIVFYIVDRLMGQVGLAYDLPAWLAAGTPTLLILAASAVLYRRLG